MILNSTPKVASGGGSTPSTLKFINGSSGSGMIYVNNEEIYNSGTDIPYADKFNVRFDPFPQTIDIINETSYIFTFDGTAVLPGEVYTTGGDFTIQAVTSTTSSGAVCYSYNGENEGEVATAQGPIMSTYLDGNLIISGDGTWSGDEYNISVSGNECILESKGAVYIIGQLILVYSIV